MTFRPRLSVVLLAALAELLACAPAFVPRKFSSNDQLFQASLERLKKKKWDDAVAGFEKLTLDLPSRDSLVTLSHFYLARAHTGRVEHLLAAQEYNKLAENFPDDSLADDALLESGKSYARLWRRPALDPQYGQLAQVQFRLLVTLYPDSPRKGEGDAQLKRLDEWFATKDFDIGDAYFRRKAYDSAIIYFRDIVKNYPNTDKARLAMIRMVVAFRSPIMKYTEDAREVCAALHSLYTGDKEVAVACQGMTPATVKPDSTVKPAAPATPPLPAKPAA